MTKLQTPTTTRSLSFEGSLRASHLGIQTTETYDKATETKPTSTRDLIIQDNGNQTYLREFLRIIPQLDIDRLPHPILILAFWNTTSARETDLRDPIIQALLGLTLVYCRMLQTPKQETIMKGITKSLHHAAWLLINPTKPKLSVSSLQYL